MQTSKLIVPYSYGYAAENIKSGSDELEVVPMERNLFLSGEINSDFDELKHAGVDSFGNPYEVSVKVSTSIKAKWLKGNSALAHPPFVRRGERVQIYRLADSDRYFWKLLGLDDQKRKLDTLTVLVSNSRDETRQENLDENNAWVIQASTHKKTLLIQSNKSDGEAYAYTLLIDANNSTVQISDDLGQGVFLDSKQKSVTLKNSSGTKVELLGEDLNITANGSVNINAKALNIAVETFSAKASNIVLSAANVAINASKVAVKGASNFMGKMKNFGIRVGKDHLHALKGRGRTRRPTV